MVLVAACQPWHWVPASVPPSILWAQMWRVRMRQTGTQTNGAKLRTVAKIKDSTWGFVIEGIDMVRNECHSFTVDENCWNRQLWGTEQLSMDPYICYQHVWESIKEPVWILTDVQLEYNRLSQRVSISVQILGMRLAELRPAKALGLMELSLKARG